jgi:hypothetical protein
MVTVVVSYLISHILNLCILKLSSVIMLQQILLKRYKNIHN